MVDRLRTEKKAPDVSICNKITKPAHKNKLPYSLVEEVMERAGSTSGFCMVQEDS